MTIVLTKNMTYFVIVFFWTRTVVVVQLIQSPLFSFISLFVMDPLGATHKSNFSLSGRLFGGDEIAKGIMIK